MNPNLHLAADYAAEQIEIYIEQNHLKPLDRLPSERKLAELFRINRITLREAISRLENEHILYSIPGSGTYLAPAKLRTNIGINFSYHDYCEANGYTHHSKTINFYQTTASDFICQKLQLPLNSDIIVLKRLRFLSQIPVMLETTYIPKFLCPTLLEYDFEKKDISLYKIFREEFNLTPAKSHYSISMVYADAFSAELLNIDKKTSLLSTEIISQTEDGQILEFCQALNRKNFLGINTELYPAIL